MISKEEEEKFQAFISQRLASTGEYERLKEQLQQRLHDDGWVDRVQKKCREMLQNKNTEHMTVNQMMTEIAPSARADVPAEILAEVIGQLQRFMKENVADL